MDILPRWVVSVEADSSSGFKEVSEGKQALEASTVGDLPGGLDQ